MTDTPMVSIVVPAYNHGVYLAECLDSILAQQYPKLEVIVIDDGSTDDTPQVTRRYEGRIVYERRSNEGQSSALNRGWRLARGEVLSYLSADDALCAGAVQAAVDVLKSDAGVVFAYGDFELMDEASAVLRRVRTVEADLTQMVSRFVTVAGPGGFFTREAYARAGEWAPEFRQNPDVDFLFRLGLTGRFARVPAILARFRVHDGSQTYQVPSIARADEPLAIASRFFNRPDLPDHLRQYFRPSVAAAHVLAARQHLRARRWRLFARHASAAMRLHPPTLATIRTAKLWARAVYPRRTRRAAS